MKIPAGFENIKEIKKLFGGLPGAGRVVGVGVTAWPRAALSYILPNFSILAYLETGDLGAIRKVCPVISMEKDLGGIKIDKENTSTMLETEKAQRFLTQQSEIFRARVQSPTVLEKFTHASVKNNNFGLFVYKGTVRIDKIVQDLNLKLMSTAGAIRNPLENKRIFRQELIKAGLEPIQGRTLTAKALDEKEYDELRQELGEKLVFQLADSVNGGGAGTFFIRNIQEFRKFRQIVREKEVKKDKDIEWVNVTKFIEGEAASIIGCATRHGVVCGQLQKQIIDQPELGEMEGRAGVWQGHDWTIGFSPAAQVETEILCKKWGEHIYQKGYKGIFGLDVMVDKKNNIYPIECNARYTGAFPVLTMMQIELGIAPFDAWHLAEWLGFDYEMELEQVNKLYKRRMNGAQLVMHNLEGKEARVTKTMKAGVYGTGPMMLGNTKFPGAQSFDLTRQTKFLRAPARGGQAHYLTESDETLRAQNLPACAIKYLRPGFSLMDIKDQNEFILADRVVEKGSLLKPRSRLGRLVFRRPVVNEKGQLLPEIRGLVKAVYDSFGVEKI